MVEMFDDRIEITNPGGLVKGLRPEDFGKKSVLRNPNIAALLHRIPYIEKMGTGIAKIRKLMKDAKLPPPQFEYGNFFTVTFKMSFSRTPATHMEDFTATLAEQLLVKGNRLERLVKILQFLSTGRGLTTPQASQLFKTPQRTMERDIESLRAHKIVEFGGAPKTGSYFLTDHGKRLLKK
jgi:ATP-dependent DNA helicase RecG